LPRPAAIAAQSGTRPGASCLLILCLAGFAAAAPAADVTVRATRNGDALEVEASAEFTGSLAGCWRVLTDYNRLAEFVPDLHASRVISREGNSAIIEQKGEARLLFFSYPLDVRLAITEHPQERIVSRAVAGNFRELHGTYWLQADQGRVRLRYSGRLVPDFYVPPFIGTLVLSSNVESTFRALVEEIERAQRDAREK
jgi:ribosome-associated toxin RatA of RatAB toxin-antitoxin module